MTRRRALFLAVAALELTLVAYATSAAEYPAAASPASPNNPQPSSFRAIEARPAVAAANTNPASPQMAEFELRIQLRLLSALAQEHRQRAGAATQSDQAQRAKWETELAEELGNRGSNIVAKLAELAAQRPALPNGAAAEADGPLSPAEADYLARLEERLQTVQPELAAASEEIQAYALRTASNHNTVEYGDNSAWLRFQAVTAEFKRLQAEQADLHLKTSQFWALRALVHNARNPPAEIKMDTANGALHEKDK